MSHYRQPTSNPFTASNERGLIRCHSSEKSSARRAKATLALYNYTDSHTFELKKKS